MLTTWSVDNRMISAMRIVLASSALIITFIDASEPDRFVVVTYAALALYAAYSIVICVLASRHSSLLPVRAAHWVDVGWYMVLIGLSSGTNSIFFFFFFFAILVASFRWGFASGLRVTIASAFSFTIVGIAIVPAGSIFQLNRFLLRPIYLLVLGYMIAYWGGSEIMSKLRLTLLKDVSRLSNPRFGVDRTLGSMMERLRAFHEADVCLIVVSDPTTGEYSLRHADRSHPEVAARAETVTEELASILMALPAKQAMVYFGAPRFWEWWRPPAAAYAPETASGRGIEEVARVSAVLEAGSFVTVPFRPGGETLGRLYLTAARRHAFNASDMVFLRQVFEHTIPVLENIRLVDQLASDASATERQRIARDLHDSVIQPYIGFKMGLAAVEQKIASGSPDVRPDIDRLIALTDLAITDLRHYVGGLRDGGAREGDLLPAVRRFAGKFFESTGIAVEVVPAGDIRINDRLAAEVFEMITEGLSNIRRHTRSTRAIISLACSSGQLSLRMANDTDVGSAPSSFTPRSIAERAAALGGRTRVEWNENHMTVVIVDIPL